MIEGSSNEAAATRLTKRDLLRKFQAIENLPYADRQIISVLLNAFFTRD